MFPKRSGVHTIPRAARTSRACGWISRRESKRLLGQIDHLLRDRGHLVYRNRKGKQPMTFENTPDQTRATSWLWRIASLVLAIPFLVVVVAERGSAAKRRLSANDYLALESVGAPVISPDGKWVAYTVASINAEKNEWESAIWRVAGAGGDSVRMTGAGGYASAPRWSPDGRYLSFLAARGDDATQVWALSREGGEAQPITAVDRGVEAYEWAPDGRRLALVIKDPDPDEVAAGDGGGDGSKTPKPWVIDRLLFKNDGVGYLDRRRTHVYVFELESKRLMQLTGGDFDDSEPAWAPDGRSVAFVSNRSADPDANYNTDIWLARADKPDPNRAPRRLTTSDGPDQSPSWSPDGSRIVYVSTPNAEELSWYAMEQIAAVSIDGGESTILTKSLDRRVGQPHFSTDGLAIYFTFDDQRSVYLARMPATGGKIERISAVERCVDRYAIGRDGGMVALVSDSHSAGNLFVVEAAGLRELTTHNNALLAGIELAEVESVSFSSPDGTEIQGFIHKPPGFRARKRYPTLLLAHGGPWAQFDYRFDFDAQLFAAHGYVVVSTNPRGSTGRGKDFRMGIWQTWGVKDPQDAIAGVDHAIELGYADAERLGVGGWSYGGILTNYVITQTDRFKAAVSGAADALFLANYGHDLWHRWWEREFGLPWENRALWEERSPYNKVEKIVTPTLWMGGEKDWNVPINNSEQMYLAMKRLGRDTLLVIYPDQGHGVDLPSFRVDIAERQLAWYGKYLSN
jgi:dipeptidyl aminopeptidase/acylaminoacyl peptidase